jgi:hypothetical protein
MLDCTRRAITVIAIAALVVSVLPATGGADVDPASDALASESLFLPRDANVPLSRQAQLVALLQAAARAGYPVRVALIAGPTDLGSVTGPWPAQPPSA